jgi:hypothetical protein
VSVARIPRRARGPIDNWRPQARTLRLVVDVTEVLEENRDYWPLSVRTIYYRLLGTGRYGKAAGLAARVGEHVANARRAGVIPWEAIFDSSMTRIESRWWDDEHDWLADARSWAEDFRLDRQQGQAQRLLVWCEAKGMAPMLATVTDRYGIEVLSGSGYDSTTVRHDVGVSTWGRLEPLIVLHIGDLDPHGHAIYEAAAEDVTAWAEAGGGEVEFVRLAVTPMQVAQLELPDDPTHAGWVQAEAIPPAVMTRLLDEEIRAYLDEAEFASVLAHEKELRASLVERLEEGE